MSRSSSASCEPSRSASVPPRARNAGHTPLAPDDDPAQFSPENVCVVPEERYFHRREVCGWHLWDLGGVLFESSCLSVSCRRNVLTLEEGRGKDSKIYGEFSVSISQNRWTKHSRDLFLKVRHRPGQILKLVSGVESAEE